MKILFVCQQYIHASRWINQLKDSHHEIFVFDCLDNKIHSDLKWTKYFENWRKRKIPYIKGEERLRKKMPRIYNAIEGVLQVTASEKLEEIIRDIQPDLVHSIEMQSETYPLIKVRKNNIFNWAFFCWGNDLFYYQNIPSHKTRIIKVLSKVNYFFSDTKRDYELAKDMGYRNTFFKVFPGGGGYNIHTNKKISEPTQRRLILIKGYHHNFGRALEVLKAIELIADDIKEYEIYVFSAHNIVVDKIEELNKNLQLNIQFSSRHHQISHEELLTLFGKSIIAIGNSISDGIPNTMLESIILGAFPIQSNPGGATEDYINDGQNGLLIQNPENPAEIANLILKALKNKDLLLEAFNKNQDIAKELEYDFIQEKVLNAYAEIEASII